MTPASGFIAGPFSWEAGFQTTFQDSPDPLYDVCGGATNNGAIAAGANLQPIFTAQVPGIYLIDWRVAFNDAGVGGVGIVRPFFNRTPTTSDEFCGLIQSGAFGNDGRDQCLLSFVAGTTCQLKIMVAIVAGQAVFAQFRAKLISRK